MRTTRFRANMTARLRAWPLGRPTSGYSGNANDGQRQSSNMRLLTYNIHKGVGADRRYRLERVIAVIKAEAPDIICLQEVDRNVRRSRRDDQPALLADKLGAAVSLYQLNVPRGEGGYGNLLLSRWPFRDARQMSLAYKRRVPRGAQLVVVDAPEGLLHLVHIHFGLSSRERRWQAAQ